MGGTEEEPEPDLDEYMELSGAEVDVGDKGVCGVDVALESVPALVALTLSVSYCVSAALALAGSAAGAPGAGSTWGLSDSFPFLSALFPAFAF